MNRELDTKKMKKRSWSRSKKLRALSAAWVIVTVMISLSSCAYLLAEPWDQKFYGVAGVQHLDGDEIVLSVGESVTVEVSLGDNEKIASIEVQDDDVLQVNGTTITGKGQYWTTIVVTTSEIEIPQRPIKQIKIFGWDISESYDRFRTWLRDLFGIAQQPQQTELRELNIYEIHVVIVGYEKQQGNTIHITRGTKEEDPTDLKENEENILYSGNSKLVKVLASSEDKYVYEAVATGDTSLHSLIGFWKSVPEDVYNEYLEKNPQTALYLETARNTCTGCGMEYPHDGMIFVIQREISYQVKVAEPKAPGGGGGGRGSGGGGNTGGGGGDRDGRSGNDDVEQPTTLLGMVNAARAKEGIAPMTWSNALAAAAKIRAQEITELMSHTRPNGEPYYTVNPSIIYGENLAGGIKSAQSVFNAWMDSPGHRASIMNPRFRTIGYAYLMIDEKYRHYWAMEFGL